jgi:hypothetical protein
MSAEKTINGNKILDDIRYSTTKLLVTTNSGTERIGTGFFFHLNKDEQYVWPLLVTNKHMIKDWKSISLNILKADQEGNPIIGESETLTIENSNGSWISHPNVDLSVFPIKSLIEQKREAGIILYCKFIPEELIPTKDNINTISSIEDILMIGYPDGMSDSKNNLPIVRRGITATDYKIDYEGKKEFLIDASIFKGSSGSPILICNIGSFNNANGELCLGNRIKFLGVQYRGEFSKYKQNIFVKNKEDKFVNAPDILSAYFNDLGFCVKSECLLDFKSELEKG